MAKSRLKLDFDTLYGKAFKVTDPEGDPNREGFSVVTYVNGAVFNQWKERPQFKELVRKRLNEPDFLADYKYDQIVESAKKLGLNGLSKTYLGSKAMDAKILAGALAKEARILTEEDMPNGNPELQKMVGDPDDFRTSTFAQFAPNPGQNLLPNPLSPVEGDEVFFAYMIPGAIFQAHDGSQWWILGYDYRGQVEIENRWYPRIHAQVSVYDVRRAIDQWVEPIQQTVPPPPPGVNYDAQPVMIVDHEDFSSVDSFSTGHPNRGGSGGW